MNRGLGVKKPHETQKAKKETEMFDRPKFSEDLSGEIFGTVQWFEIHLLKFLQWNLNEVIQAVTF